DRALHAVRGFDELDLDLGQDVAAPGRSAPAGAEQVLAEERREEIGDVPEVEGRGPAAAPQPLVPEAVVDVAPLRIREHLVGLDALLEALLGVRCVGAVAV